MTKEERLEAGVRESSDDEDGDDDQQVGAQEHGDNGHGKSGWSPSQEHLCAVVTPSLCLHIYSKKVEILGLVLKNIRYILSFSIFLQMIFLRKKGIAEEIRPKWGPSSENQYSTTERESQLPDTFVRVWLYSQKLCMICHCR